MVHRGGDPHNFIVHRGGESHNFHLAKAVAQNARNFAYLKMMITVPTTIVPSPSLGSLGMCGMDFDYDDNGSVASQSSVDAMLEILESDNVFDMMVVWPTEDFEAVALTKNDNDKVESTDPMSKCVETKKKWTESGETFCNIFDFKEEYARLQLLTGGKTAVIEDRIAAHHSQMLMTCELITMEEDDSSTGQEAAPEIIDLLDDDDDEADNEEIIDLVDDDDEDDDGNDGWTHALAKGF
jgi:hypothetical protein